MCGMVKSVDDMITESMFRCYGHVLKMNNRSVEMLLVSVLILEMLGGREKDG